MADLPYIQTPSLGDVFMKWQRSNAQNDLMRAQTEDQQAKTNLLKAQVDNMGPQTPVDEINYLQNILQQYPDEYSAQNMWAQSALGSLINSGAIGNKGSSGSRSKSSSPFTMNSQFGGSSEGGQESPLGDLETNPASIYRTRGTQYIKHNPDGTYTVFSSPTTPSTTQSQAREQGRVEANVLNPVISKGLKPYRGGSSSLNLAKDIDTYKGGLWDRSTPEEKAKAKENLLNLSVASRLVNQALAARFRQMGVSAPGEQLFERERAQMFPGMPSDTLISRLPSDIQDEADKIADSLINQASIAAIKQSMSNFPQQLEGKPDWVDGFGTQANTYKDLVAAMKKRNSMSGKQNNSNVVQIAQLKSQAQKAIENGADPKLVNARLNELLKKDRG